MAYAAGVDVGSTQTKAVLINEAREIVGRALAETGANVARAAESTFQEALQNGDLREEEVEFVIGTGYGRYKVTFGNAQVTEISGGGATRRLRIRFARHGEKTFVADKVKLTVVTED